VPSVPSQQRQDQYGSLPAAEAFGDVADRPSHVVRFERQHLAVQSLCTFVGRRRPGLQFQCFGLQQEVRGIWIASSQMAIAHCGDHHLTLNAVPHTGRNLILQSKQIGLVSFKAFRPQLCTGRGVGQLCSDSCDGRQDRERTIRARRRDVP